MDNDYYDSNYMEGDLYTWINNGNGTKPKDDYGQQNTNKDEFYIRAKMKNNAENADIEAYMKNPENKNSYDTSHRLTDVKEVGISASQVYKIKIYVSPHSTVKETKVTFNNNGANATKFIGITDETTNKTLQANGNLYTLEGGENGKWYNVDIEVGNNNKINFDIEGILSIEKSIVQSGYAMIVYGNKADTSEDSLDGDLIFEYVREDKSTCNPNETSLIHTIKVKNEDGTYREIAKDSSNNIGKDKFDENKIEFFFETVRYNRDKNNSGEYIIQQNNDTSNFIRVITLFSQEKLIYNNDIYKDLRDIKEILLKFDKNTKLYLPPETQEYVNFEKITDNQYSIKLIFDEKNSNNNQPPKIKLKFDISKYDETNIENNIANFKISFTFK